MKLTIKRFIFVITALVILTPAKAISFDCSNNSKLNLGLRTGFSLYPSWELEFSAGYRPFRYLGANLSFLYMRSMASDSSSFVLVNEKNKLYSNITNATIKDFSYHYALKAELQFTTPGILLSGNEMSLSLRVSPGLIVPMPTNKTVIVFNEEKYDEGDEDLAFPEKHNKGAKFCAFYVRSDIVLEFEEQWEFTIGYTFNTLDIYGGIRNLSIDGTPIIENEKEKLHTISIGLTYKF